MWAWHTALKAELERELAAPGRAPEHVELLRHLKPHTMSSVAVVTVLRCLQSSGLAAMPDSSAEAAFEADYSGATMAALVNVCQLIGRGVEVEHGLASLETASDGAARRAARQLEAVLRKARGERSSFASLLAVRGAVARAERETKEGIRAGDWSLVMQVKVGAYLLDLLVKTARIDIDDFGAPREPVPCFEVATARKKGSWRIGILRTKNGLTKILSSEPVSSEPVYLPMVVKPKPWVSYNSGGYYTIPVDVVRLQTTDREALQLIKDADERGHLDRVYLGLDILGDTPWKVNDQVLAVVQDLWATGEAVAGLPSGIPIEVPPEPTETDRLELGPDEFRALRRQYLAAAKAEMERYSMRCSESYAVEIARSFAGRTLYFPHNVDFRGRAYPIPTHLNHMRNDLTRGLLSFGQGRKLGARGFWWLHVHMANVCGTNKLDLEGRKAWTEARMEDILDSADNPLTGRKWWMAQEKPFQCLAACIELAAAMRHPDGPEEYVSFLPVHQDGTCNGLQHYAALGGDREGGKQVNVVPGPKPGDVYSGVAEIVAKLVRKDYERAVQEEALTGNKPTDPDLVAATLMHDKITRKLIKQTVMTNTYGVTLIGAKDQIRARLRENRGKDHDMDEEQISRCALYVAHKVFAALGQTFAGAKKLQAWMNDTAALIGKSINQTHLPKHAVVRTEVVRKMGLLPASANAALEEASASDGHASLSIAAASSSATEEGSAARYDAVRLPFSSLVTIGPIESDDSSPDTVAATQPVTWTSPVGLPVMQPYRKLGQSRIQTALAAITVNDPTKPGPVNARKQSTAFPPNFVHSLDAAHMLFTAISMKQANLAFAAVHDSFWTHAVDVDEMSRIIREEFVRVHEGGEVLKALYREFVARYSALGQCSPVKLRMTVAQAKAVEAEVARIMDTKAKAVRRKKGAWDPDSVSVAPEGEEPTVEMEVWTQLAVPELPQRGPLDIREVLDSTFFFH
ncbi:hypothetical protein DFJ74DRAFT_644589 [Hyaloraphidium curvatum]|nr:hypothetical protein DFJ74DRAFT_644589 [Hyaloraphidium curvatum]